MKKTIFHNSFFTTYKSDAEYIWVPLSEDSNVYIQYYLNFFKSKEIEIEDLLLPYLEPTNSDRFTFFSTQEKVPTQEKETLLLYAQSDTLANSCLKIYQALKNKFNCILIYPIYNDEGAESYFKRSRVDATKFSKNLLKKHRGKAKLYLLNDWSKEAKRIISLSRVNEIPTFCIQESIIDFSGKIKRMQNTDYVLMQGIQSVIDLNRKTFIITGNPRYKLLSNNQRNKNILNVLINCNFTYGIFEDVRKTWIEDIVSSLREVGVDYLISQHPRDKGDLSKYKGKVINSNSSNVSNQIGNLDILITRFSSLIHESILQRKIVIYYNPHNEKMKYDFKFNDKFLFLCKSQLELVKILTKLNENGGYINQSEFDNYIVSHCMPIHTSVFQNISVVSRTKFPAKHVTFFDYLNQFIFSPSFVRLYRNIFN